MAWRRIGPGRRGRGAGSQITALSDLSPREMQVLQLLGSCEGNRKMIATRLGITRNTVDCHVESIASKLGGIWQVYRAAVLYSDTLD